MRKNKILALLFVTSILSYAGDGDDKGGGEGGANMLHRNPSSAKTKFSSCQRFINSTQPDYNNLMYNVDTSVGNQMFNVDPYGNLTPTNASFKDGANKKPLQVLESEIRVSKGPMKGLKSTVTVEVLYDKQGRISQLRHSYNNLSDDVLDKYRELAGSSDKYTSDYAKAIHKNFGLRIPFKTVTNFKYNSNGRCFLDNQVTHHKKSPYNLSKTTQEVINFSVPMCNEFSKKLTTNLKASELHLVNTIAKKFKTTHAPAARSIMDMYREFASAPSEVFLMDELASLSTKDATTMGTYNRMIATCKKIYAAENEYYEPASSVPSKVNPSGSGASSSSNSSSSEQ